MCTIGKFHTLGVLRNLFPTDYVDKGAHLYWGLGYLHIQFPQVIHGQSTC